MVYHARWRSVSKNTGRGVSRNCKKQIPIDVSIATFCQGCMLLRLQGRKGSVFGQKSDFNMQFGRVAQNSDFCKVANTIIKRPYIVTCAVGWNATCATCERVRI